jgi:hypothetical protein
MIDREQFNILMVDLAIIHQSGMRKAQLVALSNQSPLANLLWTILTQTAGELTSLSEEAFIPKNDVFRILSAVVGINVPQLIDTQPIMRTQNPLLFRNKEGHLVFVNSEDLSKFSIKFGQFKIKYANGARIRRSNIQDLRSGGNN